MARQLLILTFATTRRCSHWFIYANCTSLILIMPLCLHHWLDSIGVFFTFDRPNCCYLVTEMSQLSASSVCEPGLEFLIPLFFLSNCFSVLLTYYHELVWNPCNQKKHSVQSEDIKRYKTSGVFESQWQDCTSAKPYFLYLQRKYEANIRQLNAVIHYKTKRI